MIHRARRARNLLRARLRGGAVVLLYHRVARPVLDPFGLCVSPENFAAHMEILAGLARPTPLRALAPAQGGLQPRSVAVTFDDAYEDILTEALPILERWGIPATVFAVPEVLGHSFWWDRMTRIPQPMAAQYLESGNTRLAPGRGGEPQRLLASLHARLLPMDHEEREQVIRDLSIGSPSLPRLPRTVTPSGLRSLHDSATVEVGAHTLTHPNLAELSVADQEVEVRESRRALENLLDTPVTSFAYPFGTFAHYSSQTSRIVAEGGFERACTAEPGVVIEGGDSYGLPRLWVKDWSADEFRHRLMSWLR